MRVSSSLPVRVGRRAAMAMAVVLTFGMSLAHAQGQQDQTQGQQAGQQAAAPAPQAAPAQKKDPLVLDSDQAFIIYVVKPDKVADFESAWAQIRQLYAQVDDPNLKAVGQSFTILKLNPPTPSPNGVYYYFYVSQAVKDASYDPSKIIYYNKPGADPTQPATPLMPRADADALYQKLGASIATLSAVPLLKIGG